MTFTRIGIATLGVCAWAISTVAGLGHALGEVTLASWGEALVPMALSTAVSVNCLAVAVVIIALANKLWTQPS